MSTAPTSVLVSVYVLDVCVEGKSIAEMVYGKDYVCLRFNHHAGAVEGCCGVFNCLFVVTPLLHHCGCDIEEVKVVECMENFFQFDAVGCISTYIGHEESCREVFCVPHGYYPCSSRHLLV